MDLTDLTTLPQENPAQRNQHNQHNQAQHNLYLFEGWVTDDTTGRSQSDHLLEEAAGQASVEKNLLEGWISDHSHTSNQLDTVVDNHSYNETDCVIQTLDPLGESAGEDTTAQPSPNGERVNDHPVSALGSLVGESADLTIPETDSAGEWSTKEPKPRLDLTEIWSGESNTQLDPVVVGAADEASHSNSLLPFLKVELNAKIKLSERTLGPVSQVFLVSDIFKLTRSELERREMVRQRNRSHAKLSRLRRKKKEEDLEKEVSWHEAENASLLREVERTRCQVQVLKDIFQTHTCCYWKLHNTDSKREFEDSK